MIEPGEILSTKEIWSQILYCSCCGKTLGSQGWEGEKEVDDVEEKGWEYCPYCGEPLYE